MKIIQRPISKIPGVFIAIAIAFSASAQTASHRLHVADSLFHAKRYTQSLEHYEEILQQRQYTPAMLLKMAYVNEGLNHIGPAMYYLNLYYLATNDDSVLPKMDELAEKYDLAGYEIRDSDRFWSFYRDNHLPISLALAAVAILMLSVMYYTRTKLHSRPIGSGIALLVTLVALFAHQQYGGKRTLGILADATTYVMSGPSAGATVLDIVGDGHRVEMLGKNDVWLKIKWADEVAYVKEQSVREVRL